MLRSRVASLAGITALLAGSVFAASTWAAPTPELNVAEGEILTGEVMVAAIATQESAEATGFQVDGQDLTTRATVGTGTAAFVFDIGSNASQVRFGNSITINSHQIMLVERDYKSETVRIEFPAEFLVPGTNTVEVITGTNPEAACGVNHDDFAISNVGLDFSGGTVTPVQVKDRYLMGDGLCNEKSPRLEKASITFDVDPTAPSVGAVLDTTTYAEGEHVITLVDDEGHTLSRTVQFDNAGPTLVSSTPAAGSHLSEPTVLEVELDDTVGVDTESISLTLDGTPVEIGDIIGAGLAQGTHTIEVTASDVRGHVATHSWEFTSSTIPDGYIETSTTARSDAVNTLNATVTNDSSENYEVSFQLAQAVSATTGSEGTTVSLPEVLDPEASGSVDMDAVRNSDQVTDRSPDDLNGSWQRFDVEVGQYQPGAAIQWRGMVDPQREAYLRVWNNQTNRWDEIQSKRGALSVTVLRGAISEAHVADGVVKAMVVALDPFADDMNEPVDEAFEDPADYDFAIAHLTDTQFLSENAAGDWRSDKPTLHPQAERDLWNKAYGDVWRWVVDNAKERKIVYAAHTGDIVNNNIEAHTGEMAEQVAREFEVASANQQILEDSGIPNGVLAGNHDNQKGADGTLYNQTFGPDRYEEVSKNWPADASYGGGWKPGDNQNHYDLFSAGGLDFVAVYLSYGITDEDITWANSIFEKYSNRNGLLFSHAYLAPSPNEDGRGAPYSGAGGEILAKGIVDVSPNVVMTFSGHHHGVALNVRKNGGEQGNHYVEMMADYQAYEVPVTNPALAGLRDNYPEGQTLRFGSSFFRLLQFDVDRGEVVINSYSPFLDEFGTDEYDGRNRYNGSEDELRVPIQLTSRTTSLATDDIAVVMPTDQVLGTDTAAANEAATLDVDFATVEGLPQQDDLTVGWIAIARNETGGVITSGYNLLTVNLAPTPDDDPSEPSEDPTEPGGDPSQPVDDPSEPGDEPTEPGSDPSQPGNDPSEPGDEPTDPADDPSADPVVPQPTAEPTRDMPAPQPGPRPGLPHTGI